MFQFREKVRYSEVDCQGKLRLDSIVNYMQDCVNLEAEELGVGIDAMYAKKRCWVLNSWQIVIEQLPKYSDVIDTMTQAYGCEKMFGYRNFQISNPEGKALIKANSIWVYTDMEKGKLAMVSEEEAAVYGEAEPIDMEYAPRKIKVPKEGQTLAPITVTRVHLDTNQHMNNGQYVRIASGYVPEDRQVTQIRVEYKKPAKQGDVLIPVLCMQEEQMFLSLQDEVGKAYAVVQFFLQ